jgi:PAS domain-containing protein
MSNAATWNDELSARVAAEHSPAHPRVFVTWALILAVTGGLSAWVYFYSKATLHQRAVQVEMRWGVGGSEASSALLGQLDQMALRVGVIGLAGSVACLIAFSVSIKRLRNQLSGQAHKFEEQHSNLTSLRNMLSETRQTKEELLQDQTRLEAKLTALTAEKLNLEEELNRRNQAERALKQKRFELESSKSVLEMHVQARTEALQSLQRRYEMILNSAGEGICGLDAEGKATFVNPTVAKLTGWPVDELVGKLEREIFACRWTSGCCIAKTVRGFRLNLSKRRSTRMGARSVRSLFSKTLPSANKCRIRSRAKPPSWRGPTPNWNNSPLSPLTICRSHCARFRHSAIA